MERGCSIPEILLRLGALQLQRCFHTGMRYEIFRISDAGGFPAAVRARTNCKLVLLVSC